MNDIPLKIGTWSYMGIRKNSTSFSNIYKYRCSCGYERFFLERKLMNKRFPPCKECINNCSGDLDEG